MTETEEYILNLPISTPIINSEGEKVGVALKYGDYPILFRCVAVTDKGRVFSATFTSRYDYRLIKGKCQSYEDAKYWGEHVANTGNTLVWDNLPISYVKD